MKKLAAFVLLVMLSATSTAQAATAPPTNVHVTAQTQTNISIAWNGSATKYAIWKNGTYITRVRAHSYNYTDLTCGTSYQLGVRSVVGSQVSTIVYITGTTSDCVSTGGEPPPQAGYFPTLLPVGSWSSLPSDSTCANQVHMSTWEPRPDNNVPNHTVVNAADAHASFAARQYDTDSYNSLWNTWLLPRVDGQFQGTTDEIFQWAACKWGIPDNVLRGIAVRESTWFQREVYANGRCVSNWSCGDFFSSATADSIKFCNAISQYGHDYNADYGAGLCPKTFSITGIMSWDAPAWQAPNPAFPDNQNGTFPFSRNSTAFAEDYIGAHLRGCYEGWMKWLGPSGDLWGCVGSWYSGDWHSTAADGYISRVQNEITNHRWLQSTWPDEKPSCSTTYGCPLGYTQ